VTRYTGPATDLRRCTERATLVAPAGRLPVPAVLPDQAGYDLVTAHVGGVHGQELIERGHAAAVSR
jgi:hypothetical protein